MNTENRSRPLNSDQEQRPPKLPFGNVLAAIRSDILDLSLRPGLKLRFENLKSRYETGSSPLREALSRLAEEGLVIEDVRGFSISNISVKDYADLTTLRRQIEVMATTNSMDNGDDHWEASLVGAFHHLFLASTPTQEFPSEWASRHSAFHEALVAACDSPRLLRFRRQLFEHFMRYQRMAPRNLIKKSVEDVENRHRAIIDAVLSRETKIASQLISEHIQIVPDIVSSITSYTKEHC